MTIPSLEVKKLEGAKYANSNEDVYLIAAIPDKEKK